MFALFFLSGSVLAHSTMHNDFESVMKRMFKQMQMMDMYHEHLFEGIGKKNNNQRIKLIFFYKKEIKFWYNFKFSLLLQI